MFWSFLHIRRKAIMSYPLNTANTHAIPSLLTGYPQVVRFSGDGVLFCWSGVLYLSSGEEKKDGSSREQKMLWK